MTLIIPTRPNSGDSIDLLAAMLTSSDENQRCLGRAFASRIGDALQAWLNAEQARCTDPIVLLNVVAILGMQHVASVAAHVLTPGGDGAVVSLTAKLAETKLAEYIATIRAAKGGAA